MNTAITTKLSNIFSLDYTRIFKTTLLITTIFLIALSVVAGSYNSMARQGEVVNQEMFNNPEAMLNVTFKDNVYQDNIIDNELNSNKNWQGLTFDKNTFGISSLSSLSNIGGRDEMVSIYGQLNPKSAKRVYNEKLQELIVKIDDIKNNNQSQELLKSDEVYESFMC